jgi:hypothetical protein
MYRFYADDNYAKKPLSEKDDIFIYGGILISLENERKLINEIKRIKSNYTHPNLPIKWNIKDSSLKKIYKRFNRQDDLQKLKEESKTWRKEIIETSLQFDYTLFFSCLENYQKDKKDQKSIKDTLTEYMFSNTLMRVGIHVNSLKLDQIIVILDWPSENNSDPFNREYYQAYYNGKSQSNVDYISGPLINIGFSESVVFSKCTHSTMLQLCDILVGCLKDFIISHLKNKESLGKELFEMLLPKVYGYPTVFKYGINVSKQNPGFREEIKKMLDYYVF